MPSIPREQLEKVSYIRHIPSDGRSVPLHSYFDPGSREWRLFLEVRPGEIGHLDAEPVSGSYLATEPVDPARDLHLPLGTLVTCHLSFPDVLEPLHKLENGLHRCAAILEKYHLFWRQRRDTGRSSSLLVESELEYLLFLLRGFYDLLQQLARQVTKRLVHLDESRRRVLEDLPRSFADVVIRNEEVLTESELQKRYGMPAILAEWYTQEASFFKELRELRNGIAHHGRNVSTIFELEWGFAIDPTQPPWNRFAEWPPERRWHGKLGALRSVFVGFIIHTMQASTRFANVIAQSVQLPPSIIEARYFIRSPFGSWLVNLGAMREQPWEELG